jgi:hypothetical protein
LAFQIAAAVPRAASVTTLHRIRRVGPSCLTGSGYGIAGVTSVTLRAYNSAGQLIDTVTQPITTPQPASSSPH